MNEHRSRPARLHSLRSVAPLLVGIHRMGDWCPLLARKSDDSVGRKAASPSLQKNSTKGMAQHKIYKPAMAQMWCGGAGWRKRLTSVFGHVRTKFGTTNPSTLSSQEDPFSWPINIRPVVLDERQHLCIAAIFAATNRQSRAACQRRTLWSCPHGIVCGR